MVKTRINGDLQFEANEARMVARNSTILANLQAFQNTGGLVLQNNRIAENLQCKENNPPPHRWRQPGRRQGRPVRRALAARG